MKFCIESDDDAIAIKTVNLFSDAQDTIMKSKERMTASFEKNNADEVIVEEDDGNT